MPADKYYTVTCPVKMVSFVHARAYKPLTYPGQSRAFYGAAVALADAPEEWMTLPDIRERMHAAQDNGNDVYHVRASIAPVLTLRGEDLDAEYRKLQRAFEVAELRRIAPDDLFEGANLTLRIALVTMSATSPKPGKRFLAIEEVTFSMSDIGDPYAPQNP